MTALKKILLVEDEVLIVMAEQKELAEYGYDVTYAHSAKKAIEIFQQRDIDLVLMDINLESSMDGIDAAREILKIREVPVLFLSSHTEREDVHR